MRYETKFITSKLNLNEIINIIKSHPAIFEEVYLKRNVNNIYFDNSNLTSFIDNIEGEKDRKKVRIRWYGNLFGLNKNPALEIKFKTGQLGWKKRFKLNDFNLNRHDHLNYKKIFNTLEKNKLLEKHKLDLHFLTPSLLNSYKRTYYLSYDKKYRITVDNDLLFYSINPINNFFNTFTDQERVVIELKYDKSDADGASGITNFLPFRITKNSKYVVGIERLRNWK